MAYTKPTKDTIKQYYADKKWNERMVRAAVVAGAITKEECEEILASTTEDDATATPAAATMSVEADATVAKTTTAKKTTRKKTTTKKTATTK